MKSGLRTALLLAAVAATGATACGPGVYWCACLPNVSPLRVCGTFLNRHGGRLDFRCRVVDGGWFSSAPYLGNERSHHMLALLKKKEQMQEFLRHFH